MLEDEEAAVAMTPNYNSETCDDEESKRLVTVQPLSLQHDLMVNSSRGHLVIWKTSGTV